MAVATVIVLGIALVVLARTNRDPAAPPRVGDHWHSAYTIYDCGNELPVFQGTADPDGIHSHQDSVIHIHPFNSQATGEDAQLGVLLDAMEAEVTRDAITTPEAGQVLASTGCGDDAAVIKVARYATSPTVELVSVFDDDFDSIPFLEDGEAFVIAKVPAGEDPPPPSEAALSQMRASQGSDLISTGTVPLDTTTTAPDGDTTEDE
ncbi:MAG: hypothetical protein AAGA37_20275 [Actinomycetota bacterium]